MTRLIALLLLVAWPVAAQDAPDAASTSEETPADPVAVWEADRAAVLDGATVDLAAFEYLARPLVVFADNPRQPQFVEQMRLIERAMADLARRDVAVIVDADPDARSALRRALRPRGFAVVLVDKDGRVVLRQPAPTEVREIARAIDRTPIREEELRGGR